MINVHKIKDLHIDAPLPRLVYDKEEAKIAQIPGWAFYLTPHSAWYKNNLNYKERVNGYIFSTIYNSGINEQYLRLGTFTNGDPCLDFGYEGGGCAGYTSDVKFNKEMSFFCVSELNYNRTGANHAVMYLTGVSEKYAITTQDLEDYDANSMSLICGFNASGLPSLYALTLEAGEPGAIVARSSKTDFDHFDQKLCSFLFTYSKENKGHIFINGVDSTDYQNANVNIYERNLLNDYARIGQFLGINRTNLQNKVAAIGMLNIDLSKPENAAYLDTLNSYIASKYTLEDVLISE